VGDGRPGAQPVIGVPALFLGTGAVFDCEITFKGVMCHGIVHDKTPPFMIFWIAIVYHVKHILSIPKLRNIILKIRFVK
jgi:hypothetical protein